MTCEETIELMSASLDGMLDEAQQKVLDAHLSECADCRAELVELRRALSLLHSVDQVDVPPGLDARIRKAIREPAPRTLSWNWFNHPQVRVALAACVALMLGIFAMQNLVPKVESHSSADVTNASLKELPGDIPQNAYSLAKAVAPPADSSAGSSVGAQQPAESGRHEHQAPARAIAPAPGDRTTLTRKRAPGAIWQDDAPSVRDGGLQVGTSTPLVAAESGAAAPRPSPAPALTDRVAEIKADDTRARRLKAGVAADVENADDALSREKYSEHFVVAAPATPVARVTAKGREDLHGMVVKVRRSFTVAGVGEARALALLKAVPPPSVTGKERARSVRAASNPASRSVDSTAALQPVVTHLKDGRVSIVTTVPSTDLAGILATLGHEGTVREVLTRSKPLEAEGPVLLELVLIP